MIAVKLDKQKNSITNDLFKRRYQKECSRVNRFIIWLMIAQWIVGIAFAAFYSPLTWIGEHYQVHIHVWAAILIGGGISGLSVLWTSMFPHAAHTRHVNAICQMLWSALLIHLSGGRIETHFHVFASLAILSIYRDWKILITATIVVALDHFVRGVFYPLSAFGIVTESPFRWIEHAAWVIFEIAFLVPGCVRLRNEIRELCVRQTEIEEAKASVELKVEERTRELATATTMLNTILKNVPEGIVAVDESGNIVCFNDRAQQIFFGETHQEGDKAVAWSSDIALFEPDGVTEIAVENLPMNQAMQGQLVEDREVVVKRGDENALIKMNANPLNSDTPSGAVCVFRDITDERQKEHNLRMLRAAVDNSNEAMFTVNAKQRFVGVNEFACRRLGYSKKELLNLSVADICASRPYENWESQWEFLKQNKHAIVEAEHVTKDGRVFPVEVSQVFINYDGEEYIFAFARDITKRRRDEKERARLASELQDAARMAGMAEVATGVLHNVGNILNSVNVSACTIRRKLERSALSNLERVSDLIRENEGSIADFIRDDNRGKMIPEYIQKVTGVLLKERNLVNVEFDDLEKNVDHIKEIISVQQSMATTSGLLQELSPNELIKDVLVANKASLANHDISFVEEIDESISQFTSDKHRILQILINLVKNAKDALVESKIQDPEIKICVQAKNEDQVVFQIIDNGVGIPSDMLEKIFRHGFTTKKSGHGFGLHSCANAATELGGKLTARSEGAGKGATFELTLPVHNVPEYSR